MGRFGRFLFVLILLIIVADRHIVYADDSVRLMVGRSTIVNVGTPIARVSLTTADIADAMVTSPSELLINGKTPGTISMFVWDRAGAIKRYEVIVQRDLARLTEQVEQLFPGEKIEVRSNGKDIVLSGTVKDKAVIDKAINLASGYVDKKEEIVNLLTLQEGAPSNQVLLKVRFAEVSRSVLTELGVNLFTSPTGIKNTIGSVTTGQFPTTSYSDLQWTQTGPTDKFGGTVTSATGKFTFSDFLNLFLFNEKYDLGALVKDLQTRGLFQSLAEPNLVAESGKEASFLAGGEIPVPIAQPSGGAVAITVQWKEFGVRLNFTPVVNGDRVHLKVRPEVSTLDFTNAIVLNGFRIPALTTRRTETELELQNGQTFAVAGLINNQMNKTLQKMPGIGDIPILGLLFQSQAAQKDRTELVVMITPVILPNNSKGVTGDVPRLQEPYLPALPDKKSHEAPTPAFSEPRGTAAIVPQPAPVPVQPAPTAASNDAAAAAAKVQALTPNARTVVKDDTLASKPVETPTPSAARPLTPQEQKTIERARQMEAEALKKQREEQAKRDAEAAKKAAEEAKRQAAINRAAEEVAAKRNAEIAKKQAELAKKQAEDDKKREKEVADAEAKLKAAQAAYDAEVAKTKKPQQQQQ